MRQADYAACQRILWQGSRSFAAASYLLPARLRGPAAAVYAFCRIADDAVDRAPAGEGALEALRARLDRIYRGGPADHPVERAFGETVQRFAIPRAVPEALLQGFEWDLAGRRYETLSELRAYCARVAATVGVMMALLMERRSPQTLARACDLGVAMQLTNIARDVGEDARAGRVYLPTGWLHEAGIEADAWLTAPRFVPALGAQVKRLLADADVLYRRAERGITRLPRDCRASIAAARLIYADIGRKIRDQGFDSVTSRAYTSRRRKLRLLARAVAWIWEPSLPTEEPPLPETRFLVEAR